MVVNIFKLIHNGILYPPSFFKVAYNDVPFELIQRGPIKPNYYDRVYVCIEELKNNQPNNCEPIKGFICKKFSDYETANKYVESVTTNKNRRNTMIPICRWSPKFLDPFLLNMYLKKTFWGGKISIY